MEKLPAEKSLLERSELWARIVCLGFFVLGLVVLGHKYYHFGYYDWDLALYSHVLWNLAHGSLHSSLFGTNFLSNHAEYIAILLTPLYYVFPYSFTLIVLKLAAYSLGAYTLYKIAEKITDGTTGLVLTTIYLFYPANIFMLFYEFHFENLATGVIFALYYFFYTKKFRPYILTTIILLLIKENVALIPITFGVYALFSKKSPKIAWGLIPIILAIAIFYLNTKMVIPHFRSSDGLASAHGYLSQYTHLGNNYSEILKTFILSPAKISKILFSHENMTYLGQLFLPLGLFSLAAPQILFLGTPIFLQHLLSISSNMHSIVYHYAATLVPFIFLATVHGLSLIKLKLRPNFHRFLTLLLIFGSLWIHFNYRQSYLALFTWTDKKDMDRRAIVSKVPPHASVVTTFAFLNPLIQRERIFAFFDVIRDLRPFTGRTFTEKNIQYAVIDWNDSWIRAYINSNPDPNVQRETFGRINKLFTENNFSLLAARGNITLLENNPANPLKLVAINSPDGMHSDLEALYQTEDFIVTGYETAYDPSHSGLRLTMTYKGLRNIDQFYSTQITLKQGEQIVYTDYHLVGYEVYPTLMWQKGETITEIYEIPLSSPMEGKDYTLEISYANSTFLLNEERSKQLFMASNTPDLQITHLPLK